MNHLEAVLIQNEELKKRFELLDKSYSTELNRLNLSTRVNQVWISWVM